PVVLDEAYTEFAGRGHSHLVTDWPNLIILRTLSKWAGLAGMRVGYMVADPAVVEVAMKIKQPYGVSVAAEAAALAALDDVEYQMGTVRSIVEERERLGRQLSTLSHLEV